MFQPDMELASHPDEQARFGGVSGPATDEQIEVAERTLGLQFPPSYRQFLQRFGLGRLKWLDIFGIPNDSLWGDVVMMNQLAPIEIPRGCLLFARDLRGNFYYLNSRTGQNPDDGPVIRINLEGRKKRVAQDFNEFLGTVNSGQWLVVSGQ